MTALPQLPPVRTLRCSSLDGLFGCTPSVLADDPSLVRINSTFEAAEIGKAVHQLAANMVDGKDIDIPAVCNFYEVDEEDVSTLYGYAERAWGELSQFFEQPQTEVVVKSDTIDCKGKHYQIQGTGDVISPIGSHNAIFLDWKTGFLDDSYHQQMAGYAYAIWCVLGRPEETLITGIVAFLRHRYYRVVKYDATALKAWEFDLLHNVLPSVDKYRPGKTCRHCELFATCPARSALVGATLQAIMYPNQADPLDPTVVFLKEARRLLAGITPANRHEPVTGEAVDQLLVRIKLAEQQIDEAKHLIRSAVQRAGYIPMPGGMALTLRPLQVEKIIPKKAIKTLRAQLSEAAILDAMQISLPKVLAAKRTASPKGEKITAADQLREALRREGATNILIQERLEEVDLSEAQQQEAAKNAPSGTTSP